MARHDNVRPIVIKRKKVTADSGHHGGAWKVAYADFVTAMMAFFLMLWLLGSVSDDQRQGVADYFSPTLSISSSSAGGEGALSGESLSAVEALKDEIATHAEHEQEFQPLEQLAEMLEALSEEDDALAKAFEHVAIRMSDEGLIVELFDLEHAALFDGLTDEPRPVLRSLIDAIAAAFVAVPNPVAIVAHTRGFPTVFLEDPSWPLSLDRARAVLDMMGASPITEERFSRVTGKADREPAVSDPTAVRNNRIEITLLRMS